MIPDAEQAQIIEALAAIGYRLTHSEDDFDILEGDNGETFTIEWGAE